VLITVASIAVLMVVLTIAGFVLLPLIMQGMNREAEGPSPTEHPATGQRLPQLELKPLTGSGEPVGLDDLSGKVVLVNFLGTWCAACEAEAPHLAKLGSEFGDRPDFKLLAVSCGAEFPEDLEKVKKQTESFLESKKIEGMPTYADPDFTTRKAFASLGGQSRFPTTFVMDRRGVIRRVWIGFAPGQGTEKEIQQWVARLLDEEQ
jgi:peroxiredoxin